MPLAVRYVEPKSVYRKPLPRDVKNELQAVVAFSLAGTIRQISSLALQAESVLGELSDTLTDYHRRTEALERRVRHLRDDILPNIGAEEKELDPMMLPLPASHFRSYQPKDQCLLSLSTGPTALLHQYNAAMRKPALHTFTLLRDDGRNALSLYSNPEFFFDHWRKNMEKEAVRWRRSGNLESSNETPRVARPAPAASRPQHIKKGINHSATLPSRMKSRKEGKASIKDLFDKPKNPAQKRQQGVSEETFVATGREPSESSIQPSHHSSYTSLHDHESGYGSSGNQESLQRYPSSQPLSGDQLTNGGEKIGKFRLLSRNRSSSVIAAENKWRQTSRMKSTSDMPTASNFSKAFPAEQGIKESNVMAASVRLVPRRKPPPVPRSLTYSPSQRNPLSSPLTSRKQSAPSVSDLALTDSPILTHGSQEPVLIGSKVSPEIQHKGELINRLLSSSENNHETAFPFGGTNPAPQTSPKLVHRLSFQDNRTPFSPTKSFVGQNWAIPVLPTSPGIRCRLGSQNYKQSEKSIQKESLSSPPHSRPRLDSQEGATVQKRQRAWSQSNSSEESRQHSSQVNKLPRQPLPESKAHPKVTPKKKEDSSEARGHRSKTANQILKQSGVNAVINSQRNNLLLSIRQGIQLRKVQQEQGSKQDSMPWDVAAILERKQNMDFSDNEREDVAVDENEWEEN